MGKGALAVMAVSLFTLAVCDDSGQGDGSGTGGKGSGGPVLDGSSSGGSSGSDDAAAIATDAGGPTPDGSGAGGTGGLSDAGVASGCGGRSCDGDLEYCRVSVPGTAGMTGYSCIPRKGCQSCECIGEEATCTCGQATNGFITVTCRAR